MDDRMRRRSGMRCVHVVERRARGGWGRARVSCARRREETVDESASLCAFSRRFFVFLWFGVSREDRSRRGMGGDGGR